MNTLPIGLLIEGLVALLLLITIGFCVALNRRLRLLRADEHMFHSTIAELSAASMRAEQAIAALRVAAHESSDALSAQVRHAEKLAQDLARQTAAGEAVFTRISAIARAAQQPSAGAARATAEPAASAQRLAPLRPNQTVRKERAA